MPGPKIDKNTVITVGAIIGLLYGAKLLKNIFEFLGISQTQEGQNYEQNLSNANSYWNGQYWQKQGPGTRLIKEAGCEYLYNEIYDSFNWYDDNETRIYAAFKTIIKAKSQLSYFSWWLQTKKNMDLLRWLHGSNYGPFGDHLSVEEIQVIDDYVKTLPNK